MHGMSGEEALAMVYPENTAQIAIEEDIIGVNALALAIRNSYKNFK
jgi:hypothetical protein